MNKYPTATRDSGDRFDSASASSPAVLTRARSICVITFPTRKPALSATLLRATPMISTPTSVLVATTIPKGGIVPDEELERGRADCDGSATTRSGVTARAKVIGAIDGPDGGRFAKSMVVSPTVY